MHIEVASNTPTISIRNIAIQGISKCCSIETFVRTQYGIDEYGYQTMHSLTTRLVEIDMKSKAWDIDVKSEA